jgi:hypothetical protein
LSRRENAPKDSQGKGVPHFQVMQSSEGQRAARAVNEGLGVRAVRIRVETLPWVARSGKLGSKSRLTCVQGTDVGVGKSHTPNHGVCASLSHRVDGDRYRRPRESGDPLRGGLDSRFRGNDGREVVFDRARALHPFYLTPWVFFPDPGGAVRCICEAVPSCIYRLTRTSHITTIKYEWRMVYIRRILSHAEYHQEDWQKS